jgi:hypothetical protein
MSKIMSNSTAEISSEIASEIAFNEIYTRHIGGEQFAYRARYTPGKAVVWSAQVFENGDLKGEPSGSIIDNDLTGNALREYVASYIEGIIERGIGIAE